MNYTNNNFFGELQGKRIADFSKELDYSLTDINSRIDLVKDILDHEYFKEVFTQTFDSKLNKDGVYWVEEENRFMTITEFKKWAKVNNVDIDTYLNINNPFANIIDYSNINTNGEWIYTNNNTSNIKLVCSTNDSLYTESNIAKELTKIADYILAKDTKKSSTNYKFFTDEELFKKKLKEQELVNKIKQETNKENEVIYYLKKKGQNFKKEKKQQIYKSDIEAIPILQEYQASLDAYRDTIHNVVKHEVDKKNNTLSISEEEYNRLQRFKYLAKKHIALTKEDMLNVKDSYNATIYFKNALPDNNQLDWSELDMFNKSHVRALLNISKKDLTTDLGLAVNEVNNILKSIYLRDKERIALARWREGVTLEKIGKELSVTNQAVDKMINSICNKIIKEYELIYAKWYYKNKSKAEFKKCSCCKELLPVKELFFHYDSTNNRFRSKCKKCTSKKNKKNRV